MVRKNFLSGTNNFHFTVKLFPKSIFPFAKAIARRRSNNKGDSSIIKGDSTVAQQEKRVVNNDSLFSEFAIAVLTTVESPLIMEESPLLLERRLAIAFANGKIDFGNSITVLTFEN